MSGKTSIKDVARAAGVSTATVSYVLNGSRPVTEATRERVIQAAEQLNYRPNITARSLQAQRAYLLGYSWHPVPAHHGSPIPDRFIHSMGEAAYRAGYHLLAFPSPTDQDEVNVYHDLVATRRVDGIVLSATNLDDPRVSYLSRTALPFVAFGRSGGQYDYPWVDVDGRAGVRLAVEHLVAQGYERIGMLAWPAGSQSGEDRFQGYAEGLAAAGHPLREEWVVRVTHDAQVGYAAMQHLLALPTPRPTAVVCVSDLVALGALNALHAAGLHAGRDIGIVGFDNMPLAEYLYPSLTSIHQPIDEIGELVIHQLATLIKNQPLPPTERHILLEPTLVVRASSRRE